LLHKNDARVCFIKAIKYLASSSSACAHCFPQFMCKAARSSRSNCLTCLWSQLPKNPALPIYPLFSKSLIPIKALAHNLFHKICAEMASVGKSSQTVPWAGHAVFVRDGTIPALAAPTAGDSAVASANAAQDLGVQTFSLWFQ
jgi:hypothetical protein